MHNMHIKFGSKKLKGRDDFEDLAINWSYVTASKKIIIQPWKFLTLNSYTGMIRFVLTDASAKIL